MNWKKCLALCLVLALLPLGNAWALTIGQPENVPINRRIDKNTAKTLDFQPDAAKARTDSLVIGVSDLLGETNPFWVETIGDTYLTALMYDELLFANNEGEIGTGVASYTQSTDGKTFTFTINEKAKYTDGTQVTAADFINAMYLLLMPGFDGTYDITRAGIVGVEEYLSGEAETISGIAEQSERVFTVTTKSGNKAGLIYLAIPALRVSVFGDMRRPQALETTFEAFCSQSLAQVRAADATQMMYGQYILEALEPGTGATFTKNNAYWRGMPYIGTMELLVVPVDGEVEAILEGAVDIISTIGSIDVVDAVVDFEKGFINLYTWEGDVVGYLGMDLEDPRFESMTVRQALASGFDRETARRNKIERYGMVPSIMLFDSFSPAVAHMFEEQFPYDTEKAAQQLTEAGWQPDNDGILEKDGVRFSFTLTYNVPNPLINVILTQITSDYLSLGIEVIPDPVSFEELIERVEAGDYEMYFMARRLPANAAVAADLFAGGSFLNDFGYSSEMLSRMLTLAEVESDPERQNVIYELFYQQLYMELPFIPLYRRSEMLLANARVMNLTITTAHDVVADAYRLFLTDTLEGQW